MMIMKEEPAATSFSFITSQQRREDMDYDNTLLKEDVGRSTSALI
jgi:hypothetical protein